jgi:hypothetical protein
MGLKPEHTFDFMIHEFAEGIPSEEALGKKVFSIYISSKLHNVSY